MHYHKLFEQETSFMAEVQTEMKILVNIVKPLVKGKSMNKQEC